MFHSQQSIRVFKTRTRITTRRRSGGKANWPSKGLTKAACAHARAVGCLDSSRSISVVVAVGRSVSLLPARLICSQYLRCWSIGRLFNREGGGGGDKKRNSIQWGGNKGGFPAVGRRKAMPSEKPRDHQQ